MKQLLILFMLFSVVLRMEAESKSFGDGVNVSKVQSNTQNSSNDRSEAISADITGHTLTIIFNEDVGIAHIVIKDAMNGIYIESDNVYSTPECAVFIINDAGYYRMDITLSNGEQYYGYFQVEN